MFRYCQFWFGFGRSGRVFSVIGEMQAKIIDFASDKISKSLKKIEKDDVKNAYKSISSKLRKGEKSATKGAKVTSSEEYCEMLREEFKFSPDELGKPNCDEKNKQAEKVIVVEESSDGKALCRIRKIVLKVMQKA